MNQDDFIPAIGIVIMSVALFVLGMIVARVHG